jgi:hypothetical protein
MKNTMIEISDWCYLISDLFIWCRRFGNFSLLDDLIRSEYSYANNIADLLAFYLDELPVRIEKTANAAKFPEIGFVSKHLIKFGNILKK